MEHLKDEEVAEHATVVLHVATSVPRPALWLRDGQPIVTGSGLGVNVSDDGLRHSLTIQDGEPDDGGIFVVNIVGDDGRTLTSSCKVTVRGRS